MRRVMQLTHRSFRFSKEGDLAAAIDFRRSCENVLQIPRSSPKRSFVSSATGKATTKLKTVYVCDDCGNDQSQWWGYCPACSAPSPLKRVSNVVSSSAPGARGGPATRAVEGLLLAEKNPADKASTSFEAGFGKRTNRAYLGPKNDTKPMRLTDVSTSRSHLHWRIPMSGRTGMEVSRVLGGGLVPGSLVLVSGDPGVGKSTLLLQIAEIVAESDEPAPVLYVSAEESVEQVSDRADRLQIRCKDIFLLSITDLEMVLSSIQELVPRAVVLDSIQTVFLPDASGSPGSLSQVKECAAALLRIAKKTSTAIFLVGHVTKSGDIAGPKTLEHMVDVVLYLEGDRLLSQRILRVVKNRYGSTKEVGVFEMADHGLEAVANPSQLFLSERTDDDSNASATVGITMEGSRPLLLEIQALCSPATTLPSKRTFTGLDPQRLFLILAVLMKQARLRLVKQDIFVNVVAGFRLSEPATDLAIAVAVCSSYLEKAVPRDMVFVGELGLGGELRFVGQLERRLTEASKLGFRRCVIPKSASKGCVIDGLIIIPCANMKEVLDKVFNYTSQIMYENKSVRYRHQKLDVDVVDDDIVTVENEDLENF